MRVFIAVLVPLFLSSLVTAADKDTDRWENLIKGKDLKDWFPHGGTAEFRVEDNCLVGKTNAGNAHSYLVLRGERLHFELKFEVKIDDALTAGVQVRSKIPTKGKEDAVVGPQVEIASDGNAGRLWGQNLPLGWLDANTDLSKTKNAFKKGEWNRYHIVVRGPSITTFVNDIPVANYRDDKIKAMVGYQIALRIHPTHMGKRPYEVRWRNIRMTKWAVEDVPHLRVFPLGREPKDDREKRTLRWGVTFNSKDGKDYLRQLASIGATLHFPIDGEEFKWLTIRDIRQPKWEVIDDTAVWDGIYFIDEKAASVRSFLSVLPPSAKVQNATYFVTLFLPEVEKKLYEAELAFARRNPKFKTEEQIHETKFEAVPGEKGTLEFKVKDLKWKDELPAPKKQHEKEEP